LLYPTLDELIAKEKTSDKRCRYPVFWKVLSMSYLKEQLAQAQHIDTLQVEEELTRNYGYHSLAFFGLNADNLHFVAPGGEGVVHYRLANNVAVVPGDPICEPGAFERVTRSFLDFCAQQKWPVVFYQAYPEHLAAYQALNLRAFKIGEEAIIHPSTFTLNGSAMANVRTSCRRAQREGITIQTFEGIPPTNVMPQLEHISNTWLESKAASETAFSTGRFDQLAENAELGDKVTSIAASRPDRPQAVPRLVTEVAVTGSGKACAFVTFVPIYGVLISEPVMTDNQSSVQGWGWSLDLMRRLPDAPPGVMELLLVHAIERFRAQEARIISLGLAPMADTRQEMASSQQRLAAFVSDQLHLLEGRRTLFSFKQKFHPHWESRYIVISSILALPKTIRAVMQLRNYSGAAVMGLLK
jgi:phosphatidylglycerol lysyltransferase